MWPQGPEGWAGWERDRNRGRGQGRREGQREERTGREGQRGGQGEEGTEREGEDREGQGTRNERDREQWEGQGPKNERKREGAGPNQWGQGRRNGREGGREGGREEGGREGGREEGGGDWLRDWFICYLLIVFLSTSQQNGQAPKMCNVRNVRVQAYLDSHISLSVSLQRLMIVLVGQQLLMQVYGSDLPNACQ